MRNIYFIAGKSGTGKDTIAQLVSERLSIPIIPIHTTREMRVSDRNTFYCTESEIFKLPASETRGYQHVDAFVYYATSRCDVQDDSDYISVGPSEMYVNFCSLFRDRRIVPIVLEVPRSVRLSRTVHRNNSEEQKRRVVYDDKEWLNIFPIDCTIDANRPVNDVVEDVIARILSVTSE